MLKLKTSDFRILMRSHTPGWSISSDDELLEIAVEILDRVKPVPETTDRLVGVGLGNFLDPEDTLQPMLFDP